LNAEGNLHLACQSLVEHLVDDLEGATELARDERELVSYRLVCALIEQRVRTTVPSGSSSRYQFCLAEAEIENTPPLLFLSRVHGPA
jgi:hypothetical protein